jgi:hypothetical protein
MHPIRERGGAVAPKCGEKETSTEDRDKLASENNASDTRYAVPCEAQ